MFDLRSWRVKDVNRWPVSFHLWQNSFKSVKGESFGTIMNRLLEDILGKKCWSVLWISKCLNVWISKCYLITTSDCTENRQSTWKYDHISGLSNENHHQSVPGEHRDEVFMVIHCLIHLMLANWTCPFRLFCLLLLETLSFLRDPANPLVLLWSSRWNLT